MKVIAGTDINLPRGTLHVCLQFQPKDLWIGAFVDWQDGGLYLCLLPCFPIHVKYIRNEARMP